MSQRLAVFLVLAAVLAAAPARAQGFRAVHSQDGFDVWAVGDAGTVFRSLDGGQTWGSYPLGAANHMGVAARGSHVWIGDALGKLWVSADHGYTFASVNPIGPRAIRSVCFVDEQTGWVCGDDGLVAKTTDAGATWSSQASGVTGALHAIRFASAATGWACGAAGALVRTTDGGTTWQSMSAPGWTRDLLDVAFEGSTVYVAGAHSFFARSDNGGASWTLLDLEIQSRSDVKGLAFSASGSLWMCGGGGFLRHTQDGGRNYDFAQHPIVTGLSDVHFSDAMHGWACAARSRNVVRTVDGGATWTVPGGGAFTYTWTRKLLNPGTSVRGNTVVIDPVNREKLYCVMGRTIYASWDVGETWRSIALISGAGSRTNAFLVSPADTNTWLAIVQDGDRVARTTDGGLTWTAPLAVDFTEYGLPLEQDAGHPNEVFFAPEDGRIWKSVDFGATWFELSNPGFRSPDDITVVPDSNRILYVGDGVTGVGNAILWRSSDGGLTWVNKKVVAGSEIPMIATSRLDRSIGFVTNWPAGGVQRTLDLGESWPNCALTAAAWGADIAKDDPTAAMFAVYSGLTAHLSLDRGQTWKSSTLGGSNYGLLAYDRATWICHQSDGVWKATMIQPDMPVVNAQVLSLVAPDGGEAWGYGEEQSIRWASQNIPALRIEYQTAPEAPWQTIAGSASAPPGTFTWLIPNTPAEAARVRLTDAGDEIPVDQSSAPFRIVVAAIASSASLLDFASVQIGGSATVSFSLTNAGTATLVVPSAWIAQEGPFTPTRTSFSIPPGESDTLGVVFEPTTVATYEDTLVLDSNAPGDPLRVLVTGKGTTSTGVFADRDPLEFLLRDPTPNPFGRAGTVIAYSLPRESPVQLVVYNVLGQAVATLVNERQPAGRYALRFPGASRTVGGGVAGALPSGVYFARLRAGAFERSARMVFVR